MVMQSCWTPAYRNVFNLVLFGFRVTHAFDIWLAVYIECTTDDEMYIYCIRVNNYFSLLVFLYFYQYSLYKCSIKGKFGNFPTR